MMLEKNVWGKNSSSSEKKAWKKNSGLYGIWIYDLCDTGALLSTLPTELTSQLGAGHHVRSE